MLRLALFRPEIPQNTGTLMRLGACLDVPIDLIEPCSFVIDDKRLKRAGMDYREQVNLTRHVDLDAFWQARKGNRVILLDVKGEHSFYDFKFEVGDTLMVGRESDGVPAAVFGACATSVYIPMNLQCRSLNVAIAAAMVITEAMRQIRQ
ncbi:MAG: tRNA (cytidine(34)-2'-O)-methyltransferase [Alphaproteobacteria bacterium]|jgi:tRNA (cytidine/uridine-2'-O-)-methyltransferase|nr:tRNA (cytidine(34)-2'-O)-methyltransferase [Alphaproteobacteria bacterium]